MNVKHGKLIPETEVRLFPGSENPYLLTVTERGFIAIATSDGIETIGQCLSVDEAMQLMAALGHQIWVAQNLE